MSREKPKTRSVRSEPPTASKRKRGRRNSARRKLGRRSRVWVWIARGVVVTFFLAALGVLSLTAVFSYYGRDLPTVDTLTKYRPPQVTRVLDRDGRVLAEVFEERRTVVPMEKIPRVLVLSVLAAEDADFYRHRGLDYAGIVRALLRDALSGRPVQGASTITQQIVKNSLLTSERTVARKVKELILARRLEQELTKDEILHLYLNQIYFGHGCYGVQEASRFYFGKDVSQLGLAEASLIAGIPQAPSRLSPLSHPAAARKRQSYVLDQLEHKRAQYWDDLPLATIRAARTTKVDVLGVNRSEGGAPEAVTVAKHELREALGAEAVKRGGYRIETTIDLDLQAAARAALHKGLEDVDKRQHLRGPLKGKPAKKPKRISRVASGRTYDAIVTGADDSSGELRLDVGGHPALAELSELARWNPDKLPASKFAPAGTAVRVSVAEPDEGETPARVRLELGPQGAVVVIDPRTRDVLALVGGDKAVFGFNRALNAVRQPGSTFKPITYALALETKKFTPASLVIDAPEVYDQWKPNNYETWNYTGAVRLRQALAQSINLVAVRVMSDVTPEAVVEFAHKLGFTTELDPSLALALGASGVRPIELVNAYATFAAGGRWMPYRMLRSVRTAEGKEVKMPKREAPRDVMQPASAYVLTSMLQSVVTEGTARAATKLRRPAAGKTGTSNRARDAWFVGYTPEIVVGVWVGYDDHRPLGKGESGGKTALPIWMDVIEAAVGERPPVDFPMPSGVERARIDPDSGLLAYEGMENALEEVFLAGTAPTETATPPDVLDSDSFLMEQMGGGIN